VDEAVLSRALILIDRVWPAVARSFNFKPDAGYDVAPLPEALS